MFQDSVYDNRIEKLKEKLEPNTIYLISNPSHIEYLTSFKFLIPSEREAFFVCGKNTSSLIYTSFSPISNFSFLDYLPGTFPSQLKEHFEKIISETGNRSILFDDKTLYVNELNTLNSIKDIQLKPFENELISEQMTIKDQNEIEYIKKACKISNKVFEQTKNQIQKGMSELEIADLIRVNFKKNNIQETAFPTIVAIGANSAKPHHQPGNEQLQENTVVLIDMGAKFNNYCSDMTRTFWFGDNQNTYFQKIEKIVKDAYSLSLETAQKHHLKKVLAKDLDNAARIHISNQGFGENFIHTTGHGLGLEIHESPSLNWRNNQPILENMTITIEPGIYLDNEFGYRHENTILITQDGVEVLT